MIGYIVKRAPHRDKVVKLFEESAEGSLELYVSPVILSETLYVASRVYEASGVPDPNREALDLVKWVESRVRLVDVTEDVALRAGELKKELRIALPDCFVISTAEAVGASPLFREVEREMLPVKGRLERLGVRFLSML